MRSLNWWLFFSRLVFCGFFERSDKLGFFLNLELWGVAVVKRLVWAGSSGLGSLDWVEVGASLGVLSGSCGVSSWGSFEW